MKKLVNIVLVSVIFGMSFLNYSCSEEDRDKDRFMNAYYDILVARESITDTSESNIEVQNIYRTYNYTTVSFKEDFFYFAEETDTFVKIVDSLRNRAKASSKRIRDSIIEATSVEVGPNSDTK